nr:MAG TPA: protein of unknown function (DUF5489) [Caudoviricetes sp.]
MPKSPAERKSVQRYTMSPFKAVIITIAMMAICYLIAGYDVGLW